MKIFIATQSYWPSSGGVQSVTKYLAEGLARKGYDIEIITALVDADLNNETHNGVKILVYIKKEDYNNFYVRGNRIEKREEKEFSMDELERENEFEDSDSEFKEVAEYKRKKLVDILWRYTFWQKIILVRQQIALCKQRRKENKRA